jgi:lysophospholipase L1-like esterase
VLPGRLEAAHLAADGFHPGPAVYAAWGEAAALRIADFAAQAPTVHE